MANIKKFLDSDGLTILCRKFQEYPDNEILGTVINAIDSVKVDKSDYAPIDKTDDMIQAVGKDVNGKLWTTPCELPVVTIEDTGKFLRVSSTGEWTAESITNAAGVNF